MNRLTLEERKRANKIRCKLLFTIDRDIRLTKKNNQKQFLINSMTLKEIEEKFLLFPNYKMKLSTTFTKIANKYMVMKTVDNKLKKNFFYTDYLQDLKKVSHSIVKFQRKRISANNIIKVNYLVDPQEMQSPLPENFTNKKNIGEKKLIKPEDGEGGGVILSNNNQIDINDVFSLNQLEINNEQNNSIKNIVRHKKEKKFLKDDDSISSLTYELIQKKSNILSTSYNYKNKKELKRRKNQLEAIRKLRQFCFQKLRNKRRCITKSSHQNLLYINNKFEEEDEKNNTSNSSRNNLKSINKNKNTNNNSIKTCRNKNCKNKKSESVNESKKKKNNKKSREKKKLEINNTSTKKLYLNSTRKMSTKIKRFSDERKSLVISNNIINVKLETDVLRYKKMKKDKNDGMVKISPINEGDENILLKNIKLKKKRTGVLKESLKEKMNKNQLLFNKPKIKNKYNNVIFSEMNTNTNTNSNNNNINNVNNNNKRNSSENNFFNRKHKTKINIYSSINLIKPIIKKNKNKRKYSECKSARNRRYSTPNKNVKINKKELKISENSINKHSNKKDNKDNYDMTKSLNVFDKKEKDIFHKYKAKRTLNYNAKIKIHGEMYKVEEEDY
jgi:hypothetical protein